MRSEAKTDCTRQENNSIIKEADPQPAKKKTVRRISAIRISAAVICLTAAVYILKRKHAAASSDIANLPKLKVNTDFGASVFEGYSAFSADELQNGNPWTENNTLAAMPVFANPYEYDGAGTPVSGLTEKEMIAETVKIAGLFDLKITSVHTETQSVYTESQKKVCEIAVKTTAECRGAKIETAKDGYILLTLTPETCHLLEDSKKLSRYNNFAMYTDSTANDARNGIPLPHGRRFTFDIPASQALEITKYLFSEYGAFTKTEEPGYNLFADYTFSGGISRMQTSVFENKGSLAERILNYNFRYISFHPSSTGELAGISCHRTDLSQKIGDYPIISVQKARKLLLENHYITVTSEDFPGERYIANTELIYRTDSNDSLFMPYYRFLAEMPSKEAENGLKNFGVFYVPAVHEKYLENLPLRDASPGQTTRD